MYIDTKGEISLFRLLRRLASRYVNNGREIEAFFLSYYMDGRKWERSETYGTRTKLETLFRFLIKNKINKPLIENNLHNAPKGVVLYLSEYQMPEVDDDPIKEQLRSNGWAVIDKSVKQQRKLNLRVVQDLYHYCVAGCLLKKLTSHSMGSRSIFKHSAKEYLTSKRATGRLFAYISWKRELIEFVSRQKNGKAIYVVAREHNDPVLMASKKIYASKFGSDSRVKTILLTHAGYPPSSLGPPSASYADLTTAPTQTACKVLSNRLDITSSVHFVPSPRLHRLQEERTAAHKQLISIVLNEKSYDYAVDSYPRETVQKLQALIRLLNEKEYNFEIKKRLPRESIKDSDAFKSLPLSIQHVVTSRDILESALQSHSAILLWNPKIPRLTSAMLEYFEAGADIFILGPETVPLNFFSDFKLLSNSPEEIVQKMTSKTSRKFGVQAKKTNAGFVPQALHQLLSHARQSVPNHS